MPLVIVFPTVLDRRLKEEEADGGLGLGERLLPPAPLAPLLRLEELMVLLVGK